MHGILISDLFEYLLLIIALILVYRNRQRGVEGEGKVYWNGVLLGVCGTLFFDVVVVDEVLRLHAVNYSEQLHLAKAGLAEIVALCSTTYQTLRSPL